MPESAGSSTDNLSPKLGDQGGFNPGRPFVSIIIESSDRSRVALQGAADSPSGRVRASGELYRVPFRYFKRLTIQEQDRTAPPTFTLELEDTQFNELYDILDDYYKNLAVDTPTNKKQNQSEELFPNVIVQWGVVGITKNGSSRLIKSPALKFKIVKIDEDLQPDKVSLTISGTSLAASKLKIKSQETFSYKSPSDLLSQIAEAWDVEIRVSPEGSLSEGRLPSKVVRVQRRVKSKVANQAANVGLNPVAFGLTIGQGLVDIARTASEKCTSQPTQRSAAVAAAALATPVPTLAERSANYAAALPPATEGCPDPRKIIPDTYCARVTECAKSNGLNRYQLACHIKAESAWNPSATSFAGAAGIAQFIPTTAVQYGLRIDRKQNVDKWRIDDGGLKGSSVRVPSPSTQQDAKDWLAKTGVKSNMPSSLTFLQTEQNSPVGNMYTNRQENDGGLIDERYNPDKALCASARFIADNMAGVVATGVTGTDQVQMAIAAYNTGLGNVKKAQSKALANGQDPKKYANIAPYLLPEPRRYVDTIMACITGDKAATVPPDPPTTPAKAPPDQMVFGAAPTTGSDRKEVEGSAAPQCETNTAEIDDDLPKLNVDNDVRLDWFQNTVLPKLRSKAGNRYIMRLDTVLGEDNAIILVENKIPRNQGLPQANATSVQQAGETTELISEQQNLVLQEQGGDMFLEWRDFRSRVLEMRVDGSDVHAKLLGGLQMSYLSARDGSLTVSAAGNAANAGQFPNLSSAQDEYAVFGFADEEEFKDFQTFVLNKGILGGIAGVNIKLLGNPLLYGRGNVSNILLKIPLKSLEAGAATVERRWHWASGPYRMATLMHEITESEYTQTIDCQVILRDTGQIGV